jgi:hypothetical protein
MDLGSAAASKWSVENVGTSHHLCAGVGTWGSCLSYEAVDILTAAGWCERAEGAGQAAYYLNYVHGCFSSATYAFR